MNIHVQFDFEGCAYSHDKRLEDCAGISAMGIYIVYIQSFSLLHDAKMGTKREEALTSPFISLRENGTISSK